MNNILIFTLFLSLTVSQPSITDLEGIQSHTALIQVLNYYGCKTWQDGTCVECSERYYFNQNNICCEVKPNCQKFNRIMGSCEKCYGGYQLINESCVVIDFSNEKYAGCKVWEDSICKQCSFKYFFNDDGECQKINDLCSKWNQTSGECLLCYRGYVLEDNQCLIDSSRSAPIDPLCKQWKDRVCLSCAERAYFDQNGKCKQVSANCRTWDRFDGSCLTCYKGYELYEQFCVLSAIVIEKPTDKGCALWDWDNQVCLKCSPSYYMNEEGVCERLDNLCREYVEDECLSCYKGYILEENKCVIDPKTLETPENKNCAFWDWDNSICLTCAHRTAFNFNGICVPLSDLCKEFNENNDCIACYFGYQLVEGVCEVDRALSSPETDKSCSIWDWENKICVQCSFRYFKDENGSCFKGDDNCKEFEQNGTCIDCYPGYRLESSNECIPFEFELKDLNCAEWDWQHQLCLACKLGAYFDENGACIQKQDLCKFVDEKGVCVQCYKGYVLVDGRCIIEIDEKVDDELCAIWDWDSKVCLECSNRAFKGFSGKCQKVNDLCKDYDQSGDCVSCYIGYELQQGSCILENFPNAQIDLGCAQWDWNNLICLKCSFRFYFDEFGFCTQVDPNCKDFDNNGNCLQCYKGYRVQDKKCLISEIVQAPDQFCALWDWDAQICLQCSPRTVFDAFGFCTPVNDFCKTYSQIGDCDSCYKGYTLIDGNCILREDLSVSLDPGCASWDWNNQICLNCSFRHFMNEVGICEQVSDLCNTFDEKGNCLSCYHGYHLRGGECVQLNVLCREVGVNGQCVRCYDGYVLLRGGCQPLSSIADIALYFMECCPEKLQELRKEGRLP